MDRPSSGEVAVKRAQRRERRGPSAPAVWVWATCALIALLPVVAVAGTSVYFEPSQIMLLAPGEECELSFRVGASDDSIASYQLYLSFDPEVVELVSAEEGSLYVESGFMTWFIEEEEYPGFWHFFDTVFGAGNYVLPPGELLHLTFRAVDYGQTEARMDTIRMTDVRRDPLLVDSFENEWIFVVAATGVSGEDLVQPRIACIAPNPFAGETRIQYSVPTSSAGWTVEIFSASGRCVSVFDLPAGVLNGEIKWDGRSREGRELPSSVYYVRLAGEAGVSFSRVVKLR